MTDGRPPLLTAPWQAEHISRLISEGDYLSAGWWNDFEDAYLTYPADNFDSLSKRLFGFTSKFSGAVWELFLWKTFKDLGLDVQVEEPLPGGDKKADFSIGFPDGSKVLVEATTRSMDMDLVSARRIEREIVRALQKSTYCSRHLLAGSVVHHSPSRPDIRRLCNDVNEWMWHHEARGGTGEPTLRVVDPSGWVIDFRGHRSSSGTAGFASFINSFMQVDDAGLMRSAIETKMRKFQTDPGLPVVIAVAVNTDWWKSDEFDRFAALYARPAIRINRETGEASNDFTDYWRLLSDNAYSSNVSGILFGDGEYPGFSGTRKLDMWLNETASLQIEPIRFPAATTFHRVREDGIASLDPTGTEGWISKPFPW